MKIIMKYKQLVLWVVFLVLIAGYSFGLAVSGITPINNRDYAPAVLKLIKGAEQEIQVMLYQVRLYDKFPNDFSNQILKSLIDARKRGVMVSVIIEASGWHAENDQYNKNVIDFLSKSGVAIYVDSPDITSHQKVMIVDDEVTVVGSLNWSFFSTQINNEVAMIVWSREVNQSYRQYFGKMMSEAKLYTHPDMSKPEIEMARRLKFPVLPAVEVIPLNNDDYFPKVHEALTTATKSIEVLQMEGAYFLAEPFGRKKTSQDTPVETNVLIKDLIEAKNRGVNVRVCLDIQKDRVNKNEDVATRLLAGGVDVYYDSPTTTTHAKMVVIDDVRTIVGSTNWSYQAVAAVNNEASVMVTSPEVARQYKDFFESIIKEGKKMEPEVKSFEEALKVPIPTPTAIPVPKGEM